MAAGQAAQPMAISSGQGVCVWQSGQTEPWCDGCSGWFMGAAKGAADQRKRAAIDRVRQMARIRTMARRIMWPLHGA